MRWVEHWIIGRDVYGKGCSLAYLLGCIMPDWFERYPIHRRKESFDRFLDKAEEIRYMPRGLNRDWKMGNIIHFACDYCTQAHNDEYYDLYKHRVYEVMAQKYFKRVYKKEPDRYHEFEKFQVPTNIIKNEYNKDAFRQELRVFVEKQLNDLHRQIRDLASETWYTDSRIMELDIIYAYGLSAALLDMFDR